MPTTESRFADPKILARINSLEIRARTVVEGVMTGMHKSPYRGSSVEFAQHRDYVPGDEIRHIDWKVYARSDRYQIKQFEEETNLKATFVLDCSTSMNYKGERSYLSKREYSAIVAAALATLLLKQRDPVGLAIFDDGVRQYIPPAGTSAHLRMLIETLSRNDSQPKTAVGDTLHDLAERLKRRGMLIVLSDLFGDPDDVLRGLQHFKHRKHEAIIFHVLDRDELTFPFRDSAIFEGMEGEASITAEPNALRRQYLAAFEEYVSRLRRGCRDLDMDYQQMPTDLPIDEALARYLSARADRS
jgi:uncharacterized protein (DUF58 family)